MDDDVGLGTRILLFVNGVCMIALSIVAATGIGPDTVYTGTASPAITILIYALGAIVCLALLLLGILFVLGGLIL